MEKLFLALIGVLVTRAILPIVVDALEELLKILF